MFMLLIEYVPYFNISCSICNSDRSMSCTSLSCDGKNDYHLVATVSDSIAFNVS